MGLQDGPPDLTPTKQVHQSLQKRGHIDEARALKAVVLNKSWCGDCIAEALKQNGATPNHVTHEAATCKRCNTNSIETPFHKDYTCPDNNSIDDPIIGKTNFLVAQCKTDSMSNPCKWFRALLPTGLLTQINTWIDEDMCKPSMSSDFIDGIQRTAKLATDGAGGNHGAPRFARVASAAAYMRPDGTFAVIEALTPGRQAVPRAELYAIILVLQTMVKSTEDLRRTTDTFTNTTIYVDASYVCNGLHTNNRTTYIQGINGDLWSQAYNLYDITGQPNITKVKSHVKTHNQLQRYNMDIDMFKLNTAADTIAGRRAEQARDQFRSADMIRLDSQHYAETKLIARRLAAIEAHCWNIMTPNGQNTTESSTGRSRKSTR